MSNRREFITLLGGAAAAWPLVARAQQGERMRRIGVLTNLAENDPEGQVRHAAFLKGLQELGWLEGRNLRVESRWTGGDTSRGQKYAAELVALAPDVILTTGSAGLVPLLQVTRTIPIVFTIVPDPVGAGFVDSLSRPGGNATGFSQFEYGLSGKWLELLKELAPGVTRAAVLREPGHSGDRPVRRPAGGGAVAARRARPAQSARRGRHRPMGRILSSSIGLQPATSTASSGARSQATCRCRLRPSTSWSSI
jgi:putative ABC transport system substrate-binding protein